MAGVHVKTAPHPAKAVPTFFPALKSPVRGGCITYGKNAGVRVFHLAVGGEVQWLGEATGAAEGEREQNENNYFHVIRI